MSAQIPTAPRVNEPVVIEGKKYRIYAVAGTAVILHDRFGGGVRPNGPLVPIERLAWDRVVGLWRIAS